ncbi:BTAD domain-containing putative transcriptional regulator [Nonomuraea sp. NPDC050556]|uniref:AfsR/SARP family transcriptional regulator n=1 Tax=Nonomuraea sp. NPDC050556 TaxID=3364369 RepID=UPI0037AF836D
MLLFKVLGPLEVYRGRCAMTPSAPKLRCTLGLLLLRADSVVDMQSVIDELWGDRPPASAVTTMQTYIYQLRKELNRDTERLITKPPGYLLRLDGDEFDARVCEQMIDRGSRLLEQGRPEEAAEVLRTALGLWKGAPLSNTPCGPLLQAHSVHLEELRIRALTMRIEADMRLGRVSLLIAELRSLVALHPLNEWFYARLIEALYRAGRRGDALQAFTDMRTTLRDELGLEPQEPVQRLQRSILTGSELPAVPSYGLL